jgi:hypothetical protein
VSLGKKRFFRPRIRDFSLRLFSLLNAWFHKNFFNASSAHFHWMVFLWKMLLMMRWIALYTFLSVLNPANWENCRRPAVKIDLVPSCQKTR